MNPFNYLPIFKALADETRLSIVKLLSQGEQCGCDILEHFDITQPTLSYHMKALCDSGLVQGQRDGSWIRYSLDKTVLESVQALFSSFCSADTQNLPKADCRELCD